MGTQSIGNNYSWYPSNSLSNSTSATPVASPTTTTNYIVSIDSMGCKHTEQVRVYVYPAPRADTVTITNNICGGPTGSITIDQPSGIYQPYTYSFNNGAFVSDTMFSGLAGGTYSITIRDSNGCIWQNTYPLVVKDTLLANAYASANPNSGQAPLYATISASGSTGVNTYNWYVNNSQVSNSGFLNYTFTDSGTYVVTLIAYNNLPQCSDTATAVIVVLPEDTSGIFIPNVFSPNSDGVNDVMEVKIKNAELMAFEIYNRYGTLVFTSRELISANNTLKTVIWDGRTTAGMPCSQGTYFYVIGYTVLNDLNQKEEKMARGFLTLMR